MSPRKKVESKDVTKKDVTELGFFACQELIHEIEVLAQKNDGVLSDEQIAALVEAQTQSPAKLQSFCNFMKLLEAKDVICKKRIDEIKATQKHAKDIHDRMSAYLGPWVNAQGKSYHVGEYELKTRKSTEVKLVEGYNDPLFCKSETKIVVTPDKAVIKAALLAKEEVPGAELVEKLNLTIK